MTKTANIPFATVILAAGKGTRMKSTLPKVVHGIASRPMLLHVLQVVEDAGSSMDVCVIAPKMELVRRVVEREFKEALMVEQTKQEGTGHAVLCAKDMLTDFDGVVLVLYGDTPLITPDTLESVLNVFENDTADVVVLGMRPNDAGAYGRLVVDKDGTLEKIVEFKDASAKEKKIDLCNSGVLAAKASVLFALLEKVGNDNAKGEYYLTDVVGIARADGMRCSVVERDAQELMGVNSKVELAAAEKAMQQRLRLQAMDDGVTLVDPDSVYFSYDTKIGKEVVVYPHVFFGKGVTIEDGVYVKSFSHFEGVTVGKSAMVGPYARLRPGARIGENVHIGNFVEIKNSQLEAGVKVGHLSYIGDAQIGKASNIGAGTITCNYDGFEKHRTYVGPNCFVGSNTALVAPVSVGAGAIVGAGSVINEDVEENALSMTRGNQITKPGWAELFRKKRQN